MEVNELRAAAERLLDAYEAGQRGEPVAVSAARIYGDGDITAAAEAGERDMLAVIRWCHSELDQTPIDEAWLRSVGDEHLDGFRFRNAETGYELFCDRGGKWDYMGRYIKAPENRESVRRLASALGIPLQPAN